MRVASRQPARILVVGLTASNCHIAVWRCGGHCGGGDDGDDAATGAERHIDAVHTPGDGGIDVERGGVDMAAEVGGRGERGAERERGSASVLELSVARFASIRRKNDVCSSRVRT